MAQQFNHPIGSANKPKPKAAPKHEEPDGDEQPMAQEPEGDEQQGDDDGNTEQAKQEFEQVVDAVSSGQQPDPEMVHQLIQFLSQFLPQGGAQ